MKTRGGTARRLALFLGLILWCIVPGAQAAERELRWDALDVEAHLHADGVLDVIERHTMVFTGDWNGGERVFNLRPRQKLEFLGVQRMDSKTGSLQPLQETSAPNNVDEFTWADRRTLRWRSRLPSDPPFADTQLTYVLHYRLSGILLKDDGQYRIDHDFAFPNRPGSIERFILNLNLDPIWQPLGQYRSRYSAGPLEPGAGFVVNIPLRYSGSAAPTAIETRRPPEIVVAVLALLGMFALLVFLFLMHERSLGRFASVDSIGIDSVWIENNLLTYPAEVVGAAWDGRIGTSEVVALIARMTAEGKLESKVESKVEGTMKLTLKVDRDKLNGHERALVDGLFFDHRTETSTKEVRQHYKSSGFDPAAVIKPELEKHVKRVLPSGDIRVRHRASLVLYVAGVVLLAASSYSEPAMGSGAVALAMISLFLVAILQIDSSAKTSTARIDGDTQMRRLYSGKMRNPSLRGHVALITGANHGIGAATAIALAARATEAVVSYLRISDPGDRDGPELYRTARAQGAEKVLAAIKVGGRAISCEADLTRGT